jgi:hypothetical protein
MIVSVHQPQYLPWLGFFDKIARSGAFVFLDQVQYKEREFQNRNKICAKNKCMWLSVPVISKGKGRQLINEVQIDNTFPWRRQHLNSLKAWYAHAPHFKDYSGFFEAVYSRNWDKLVDLNVHIIKYCLSELSISTPIYFESDLGINAQSTDRIIAICKKLNADTYLSGAGGKQYLEEDKLIEARIELAYQSFSHPVYRQQYQSEGVEFIGELSILDLLFNEGPNSKKILGLE